MNTVPGQYRKVSVARVDLPLTVEGLTGHFLGREVYRHTQFVVVRGRDGGTALVEVAKPATGELFAPVTAVTVRALPGECVYVVAPEIDTGVPSALAAVARANGAPRCVVVKGRYDHVSFILDPAPVRLRVGDVMPPAPPKLIDQAQRVLDLAEDLPPVQLVPQVVDMADLARADGRVPAGHYLLPCRASGFHLDGAAVSFLDQRPPRADWTLIGCERSRAIHLWFYGDLPADTIETCPRKLFPPGGGPLLTKCCLLENDNLTDGDAVVVPWGASLALVREAVAGLARIGEPSWAPA